MAFDGIETVVGIVASLLTALVAAPAAGKAWEEYRQLVRARRYAEFERAKKVAQVCELSARERYLRELGHAALIGDNVLTHEERVALLSMTDTSRRAEEYIAVRGLVRLDVDRRHFEWRNRRLATRRGRWTVCLAWTAGYLMCGVLSMLPWTLWQYSYGSGTAMSKPMLGLQVWSIMVFVPLAIACLRAGTRVNEAEQFIKSFG